jgi:hypothetical protein
MTATVIPFKWDTALLLDILIDAVEGGMTSQWAQAETYRWTRWYEDPEEAPSSPPRDDLDGEVLMRFRDMEGWDGEEPEPEFVDVTLDTLRAAANRAIVEYKHLFGSGPDRDGFTVVDLDYDAVGSDVILQFAVLGEVIYG